MSHMHSVTQSTWHPHTGVLHSHEQGRGSETTQNKGLGRGREELKDRERTRHKRTHNIRVQDRKHPLQVNPEKKVDSGVQETREETQETVHEDKILFCGDRMF